MRKFVIFLAFCIVLLLALGCSVDNPFSNILNDENGISVSDTPVKIPEDTINDTQRSLGDSFEYKTILPVSLNITVNLYEISVLSGHSTLTKLPANTASIVVLITDGKGNKVYTGKVQTDGTLNALLEIPAAVEDFTLSLRAEGFKDKNIILYGMVKYSEINRTINLVREGSPSKAMTLADSDGDGIPDVYDAYPNDPDKAFDNPVPAKGYLTVAFEDLFGHAQAGDADYNDFIAKYKINQVANSDNKIVSLEGEAEAVAKIAGYNHLFGIYIDYFKGAAELTIDGATTSVSGKADIVLFPSTKNDVGQTKTFKLDFAVPQETVDVAEAPYNPYLYVYNTGHDIHLIGEEALPNSINPDDTFRDAEGFPWALLVPVEWIHPEETQRIEIPYPRFTLWRESFGAEHTDWYLHYYDPYVPEAKVYAAGYYNNGSKDVACYWIDGEKTDLTDGTQNAKANSIFVDGTDIYVAGYYNNGTEDIAAYWKNGVKVKDLTAAPYIGSGGSITVSGGNIYVSGNYKSADGATYYLSYWTNGVEKNLYSGSAYAAGNSVFVQGGDIYVAGYYNDGTYQTMATYWKNDVKLAGDLYSSSYSKATDIFVTDTGDVYVSGDYFNGMNYASCYWKNGASGLVTLYDDSTTSGNWSKANAIYVEGGTVYTAGYYKAGSEVACYWVDGVRTDLTDGSPVSARAKDIEVVSGSVYVAGYYYNGQENIACYWEDGVKTDIYDFGQAGKNSEALSIFIE